MGALPTMQGDKNLTLISRQHLEDLKRKSSDQFIESLLGSRANDKNCKLKSELAKKRASGWRDTLEGNRKRRLKAKSERLIAQEKIEKEKDEIEAKLQEESRKELLREAKQKLIRQEPEARELDRAYLLDNVLKVRQKQINEKNANIAQQIESKKNELHEINKELEKIKKENDEKFKRDQKVKESFKTDILDQISENSSKKLREQSTRFEDNKSLEIGTESNDLKTQKDRASEINKFNRDLVQNKIDKEKKEAENERQDLEHSNSLNKKLHELSKERKRIESKMVEMRQANSELMAKELTKIESKKEKSIDSMENGQNILNTNILQADHKRSCLSSKKRQILSNRSNLDLQIEEKLAEKVQKVKEEANKSTVIDECKSAIHRESIQKVIDMRQSKQEECSRDLLSKINLNKHQEDIEKCEKLRLIRDKTKIENMREYLQKCKLDISKICENSKSVDSKG